MPFYEFKCDGGHVTDLLCKMSEKPREVECRKCGGVARGIMSATLPTMGATPHYASKEREVGMLTEALERATSDRVAVEVLRAFPRPAALVFRYAIFRSQTECPHRFPLGGPVPLPMLCPAADPHTIGAVRVACCVLNTILCALGECPHSQLCRTMVRAAARAVRLPRRPSVAPPLGAAA